MSLFHVCVHAPCVSLFHICVQANRQVILRWLSHHVIDPHDPRNAPLLELLKTQEAASGAGEGGGGWRVVCVCVCVRGVGFGH